MKTLIEAPYLTPEEAADKRVFFGLWTLADLDTPERTARAALIRGCYDDPSFNDPGVDPLDRAQAFVHQGKAGLALTTLDALGKALPDTPPTPASIRADRLRVESLELLGRRTEAGDLAKRRIDALIKAPITDAQSGVEAVKLALARVRIAGPLSGPGANAALAAADYHALIKNLGEVRATIDRLYWPSLLAEAQLLYAKDNREQAREAVMEVLSINPSVAEAWALLGRMSVDAFNFDTTERIAARLNILASDAYAPGDPDFDEDAALAGISIHPGASAHASAILARAMLRQIDGAQAADVLEPALRRLPNRPELLALWGAAAALRFDEVALSAAITDADTKLGISHPLTHHEVGRALAEARQYASAAIHLEQAHIRSPFEAEPLIDRGLLEVQAGRDEEALNALEKGFALDPFNVRADNSLRLVRELMTYQRIETPNFTIRYKQAPAGQPAPDSILAKEMPAVLERNFAIVTGSQPGGIDHRLPKDRKTIIDLMPNHEWFGVRISGMPQIHTVAASTGPVIAMESPREAPGSLGTYDWARVIRHEYVHTITLDRTANRIPHWFTEAAAVNLELAPRDFQTVQMLTRAVETDSLFDSTYLNIAFVRPKKPADRGMAYAQGEWMYSFMIERFGHRAPLELMDLYAKGVREQDAFERVLKVSRDEFFDLFKPWAKSQLVAWGMIPPVGTSTIPELLRAEIGAAKSPEAQAALDAALNPPGSPSRGDSSAGPTPEQRERWLVKYPEHPDVLELAVESALALTRGVATLENASLIERYAKARPVDPKPHRLLAKMYLDQAAADPDQLAAQARAAITHLEFLDVREQKSPVYSMEIARRYSALSEFPAALAKAERATQLAPFFAPARELAATVAVQAQSYDDAQRHLEALALIEPTRPIHTQRLEALSRLRAKAR